jgi:uncharacterized protein with HEPN domain
VLDASWEAGACQTERKDPAVHDAVIYNLLVASEAASRLRKEWPDFSEAFELRYREVDWVAFRTLGNRYRHGYDIIDEKLSASSAS